MTELCTGGELFEELSKRGKFNEEEAALIINQVLEAVSYCHANNIVHRDIKPENILIEGKSKNIKIVEFGASQKFDAEHKMSSAYGTLHFIAPEVLMIEYDEKCDIWSVGVVLYILLSGKPPFDGESEKEIAKKIKKEAGDLVHVILYADNSSLEIPDEIMECFNNEPPEIINNFKALSDGEKKAYLDWIYAAKKEETKIERITEMIKRVEKNLKFYD